jgi:hypothetical protein
MIRAGSLVIYIRRIDDEWLFSYTLGDESEAATSFDVAGVGSEALSEDLEWERLVSAREESIHAIPVLPDRPLVIRPKSSVSIFPDRFAKFYVAVPVWLRFVAKRGRETTDIIDIPSRKLSNTWFGDPGGGELCYSLDAPLMRTNDQLETGPLEATCSLVVRNGSVGKLNFERICVHVENLSIFGEQNLWTNEIKVLFKGVDQISQISIQKSPPASLKDPTKLTDPRIEPNKSVLRKSFSLIRHFTGI